MIRIVVSGICGRMGGMVARTIESAGDLKLVGGLEMPGHPGVGRRLCDHWGAGGIELVVGTRLGDLTPGSYDVIVDFSAPPQAVACAEHVAPDGKGLVIGTTGLTEIEMAVVQEASRRAPIVVAPNMSIGVNLLFGLARIAASRLDQAFDAEIVEQHHRAKRDAPSGTAARLLEVVATARGLESSEVARLGRHGPDAPRTRGEIGVHAVRGGGIVGRHAVHLVSETEEVVLAHEAFDRSAFSQGAVEAVRFVQGRPPGLYDMQDVLGLH